MRAKRSFGQWARGCLRTPGNLTAPNCSRPPHGVRAPTDSLDVSDVLSFVVRPQRRIEIGMVTVRTDHGSATFGGPFVRMILKAKAVDRREGRK